MSNQPMPPMPARIAKLPRDHRGFPIPWFVATLPDGTRDFRVAGGEQKHKALMFKKCWVCGEQTGRFKSFVIGPMCVVNRVTAEPPCHLDCAIFSAMACPFLSRPKMRRNENDMPVEARDAPGLPIMRNPGVTCIYITEGYRAFRAEGGIMLRLDEPVAVQWFAEGQPDASRTQVMASIESGYPLLHDMAVQDGPEAVAELEVLFDQAMRYVPAEAAP